jgi:hypothetical protein
VVLISGEKKKRCVELGDLNGILADGASTLRISKDNQQLTPAPLWTLIIGRSRKWFRLAKLTIKQVASMVLDLGSDVLLQPAVSARHGPRQ